MANAFGVHSEVGKLRKVIVHRPGLDLQRLTPTNHDDLLFDDVLWVERAQWEHDQFVKAMRERGIEVLYHVELLGEALSASEEARQKLIAMVASEYTVGWSLVDEVRAFLHKMKPADLARHLVGGLTVGEMEKAEVRRIAADAGLPVYEKKESQDICFVTDASYARFLEAKGIREEQGHFVDREGNFLGNHKGVLHYTVGQRKGLGIASREPLYVVAIDAEKNEIVLGTEDDTFGESATVACPTFVAGSPPGMEFHATYRPAGVHFPVPENEWNTGGVYV